MQSHGEEILKNYLIPRAMLSSRVDGDLHKWIDAGSRGKTDELIRKKKSTKSHSAPPFYQGKKKFFATAESSRKAAGNKNIMTVHDVPLMPAVRRLHHSVEAICLELHDSHPINVINLPPQVAVTVNSLMKVQV
ncbi:uncharacterized protein [Solanum lycopersicum]|uniref:uncharacterized protein n=1 Tax=Solanum lycopersicum TaxID=4081 RepID=UPI0002768E6D|nr:uncharacterized protein LOC101258808 [Solanum lycopersicum]XP_025885391.1 uncharacterized protein LOC101258808 [Solanum lycopersicum]